ncbi:MAG: helix-turn-helix domain-containing protein [Actinomycetota bacterium]|nr:helix-turn-helix domain-containing protein [Actinomycetota bacterium]
MTTTEKPRRYRHNDPDPVTTGANLRRARIDRGITQRQLAEALGYKTPVMVTHIEQGIRGMHEDRLIVAARFLGVSPTVIRKPAKATK